MRLEDWLRDVCKCHDVEPCIVMIDRYVFEACRYKQTLQVPEGCQNPGPYTREMIYCVGKRPEYRHKLVCYTLVGDAREWYVAGYSADKIKPEHQQYNPFGHNFLLAPWDVAGKIDDGERYTYQRIPLLIQFPAK